jgi:hypothetical protein
VKGLFKDDLTILNTETVGDFEVMFVKLSVKFVLAEIMRSVTELCN